MRHLFLMGMLIAPFGSLSFLNAQDEYPANLSKSLLISEVKVAKPGATVWVALRFEVAPHWHLGWAAAGDTGLPTEVKWKAPEGVTVGELRFPAPTRFEYEGFVSYVHEGTLHVLAPVSISADWEKGKAVEISAEASWSVCNETNCFPRGETLTLTLATGEEIAYDDRQQLVFETARRSLPVSPPDAVQGSAHLGEKEIVLRLSGQELAQADLGRVFFFSLDDVVAPAETQKLSLEEGSYVLRMARAEFSDAPERFRGVLSTTKRLLGEANAWTIDLAAEGKTFGCGGEVVSLSNPGNDENQTESPSNVGGDGNRSSSIAPLVWEKWSSARVMELQEAGRPVYVDFTATWCLSCQVNKRIYSNQKLLRKMNELGVVTLKADWTNKDSVILEALQSFGRSGVPLNVFYPKGRSDLTDGIILPTVLTESNVLDALAGKETKEDPLGFGGLLAYAFLGGLILNLMPCVFPVIGLKIMSFTKLAGEEGREVVKHGIVFTIGVVLSFWILAGVLLALRAAGEQLGWGFQMQEPGFVYSMAMLLLLLGLSLSGVFEIGLSMTGAGSSLSKKTSFTGTFFSGALAVLVATPCMAP
ncbi:MAG: protein-disulfide reductase DsbD domain-containing protein, partial [Opitutales bacterium]